MQTPQKRASGLWVGAIAAVLLGLLFYLPFFGEGLTNLSYDLPLPYKRNVTPENIVIVYLDAASHDKLGQRFDMWDRKLHAQLLRRLKEDGSREVLFDLVFDQPSMRPEDDVVFASALRDHGKTLLGVHYNYVEDVLTVRRPLPLLATNAIPGATSVMSAGDDTVRELFSGREDPKETIVTFTWKAAEMEGAPITKVPGARE